MTLNIDTSSTARRPTRPGRQDGVVLFRLPPEAIQRARRRSGPSCGRASTYPRATGAADAKSVHSPAGGNLSFDPPCAKPDCRVTNRSRLPVERYKSVSARPDLPFEPPTDAIDRSGRALAGKRAGGTADDRAARGVPRRPGRRVRGRTLRAHLRADVTLTYERGRQRHAEGPAAGDGAAYWNAAFRVRLISPQPVLPLDQFAVVERTRRHCGGDRVTRSRLDRGTRLRRGASAS